MKLDDLKAQGVPDVTELTRIGVLSEISLAGRATIIVNNFSDRLRAISWGNSVDTFSEPDGRIGSKHFQSTVFVYGTFEHEGRSRLLYQNERAPDEKNIDPHSPVYCILIDAIEKYIPETLPTT